MEFTAKDGEDHVPSEDGLYPSVPKESCTPYRLRGLCLYDFEHYEQTVIHPVAKGTVVYLPDALLSFVCEVPEAGCFRVYTGEGRPYRIEHKDPSRSWVPCDEPNAWLMERITERLQKGHGILFKDGDQSSMEIATEAELL